MKLAVKDTLTYVDTVSKDSLIKIFTQLHLLLNNNKYEKISSVPVPFMSSHVDDSLIKTHRYVAYASTKAQRETDRRFDSVSE